MLATVKEDMAAYALICILDSGVVFQILYYNTPEGGWYKKVKMVDARILIKNSTSECNRELLDYLHANVAAIKKGANLKVLVVYDDLMGKLGGKIKKLPALIMGGEVFVGNAAIKTQLATVMNGGRGISSGAKVERGGVGGDVGDDLTDFWNSEMHSGVDDDGDDNDSNRDSMIKQRAMEQSMEHREQAKKKPGRQEVKMQQGQGLPRGDNVHMGDLKMDRISDLVDDDPMMAKFWENQESTPGFE